jgi:DNA-binding transcriptional LysR family regulator
MQDDPWFGVELRHLAALTAVASTGTFRGAADRLGYVQSAVSQQIATLERLAGTRLLERFRGSKGAQLTPAGEILVSHAEALFARMGAARADLVAHIAAEKAGQSAATLRVGVSHSVAGGLLPAILRRAARTVPDLRMALVESNDGAATDRLLEQGRIDIAFTDRPVDGDRFDRCSVVADAWVVVVPAGTELADTVDPPAVETFSDMPLITLHGASWEHGLRAWLGALGVGIRDVLHAETEAIARAYVKAGLGAALLPSLSVSGDDPGVAVIDLGDALPARQIALYWCQGRRDTGTLEAFCDAARSVSRERLRAQGETAARPAQPIVALAA